MIHFKELIEELERRYPDKATVIEPLSDKERIEYFAKLALIVEIKVILQLQEEGEQYADER